MMPASRDCRAVRAASYHIRSEPQWENRVFVLISAPGRFGFVAYHGSSGTLTAPRTQQKSQHTYKWLQAGEQVRDTLRACCTQNLVIRQTSPNGEVSKAQEVDVWVVSVVSLFQGHFGQQRIFTSPRSTPQMFPRDKSTERASWRPLLG